MAEASQFSPDDLDRLEDALESLEGMDLALLEEESDPVRARLADYQRIVVLAREALPLEDAPSGTLDRVLAIARDPHLDPHGAGAGLGVDPAVVLPSAPSWWSRFRKAFLIPSLAVAGSAALILIIVQPRADEAAPSMVASNESRSAEAGGSTPVQTPSPAAVPEPASPPAAAAELEPAPDEADREREDGDAVYEELATSRASKQEVPQVEPARVAGEEKSGERRQTKDDGKKPIDPALPRAGKTDEPSQTPRWDLIAQGDRARTDGDCATARRHYEAAMSDTDDRVQARANAGLGLCEAQQGRQSAADELFERAKDLDPEISAYLDQQSPPGAEAPAKPSPKKKARRKSNRQASPDEMLDAFE